MNIISAENTIIVGPRLQCLYLAYLLLERVNDAYFEPPPPNVIIFTLN